MARPTNRSRSGRPKIMTPETIQKLEEAFLLGCTDLEACLMAGISKSTFYSYQDANPDFLDRKLVLKENPVMLARGVLIDALKAKDINTAHKVIERKEGTKQRLEHTGADGQSMTWNVNVVKAGDKPPAQDDTPKPDNV